MLATLILLLGIAGQLDALINSMGRHYIHNQAVEFLKVSEQKSQETFMLLSVGKASVELVESSRAGISFFVDVEVQLGKVVAPLTDLFNYAWNFSLNSLSVLLISQMLLEIIDTLFEPFLLLVTSLWLSYELLKKMQFAQLEQLKNTLRAASILWLFLFLSFPLAITATSVTTKTISQQYAQQVTKGLSAHNQLFSQTNASDSLKDSAENTIKLYKASHKDLQAHIKTMHQHLYTHIAVGIIEIILLPILLMWLFHKALTVLLARSKENNFAKNANSP